MSLRKFLYVWHRRIGVLVSIPVLVITVSGLVLNNSQLLNLEGRYVTNPWILSWYGMVPQKPPVSLQIQSYISTTVDDLVYLEGKRVAEGVTQITGGGSLNDQIILSTEDNLLVVDAHTLTLVEKLGSESLPPGKILTSKVEEGRFKVDTTGGQYSAAADLAAFVAESREALVVPAQTELAPDKLGEILEDWRGRGITVWRLFLDLHSGALFGGVGRVLLDITGIALLLLVFSGLYNSKQHRSR